jgi:DNA mismatch repair protein MutS
MEVHYDELPLNKDLGPSKGIEDKQSGPPSPFSSILFDRPRSDEGTAGAPPFFNDLNLDQIFASVLKGREEYDLPSLFSAPLEDAGAIIYRHEVMKDLEKADVREAIGSFAQDMRNVRKHLALAKKVYYERQKESWFLDAVETYCDAVNRLVRQLSGLELASRGLLTFRGYLAMYVRSEGFMSLIVQTKKLKDELSKVTYCVHIKKNRITVDRYEDQPDYSIDVEETFQKFKQGWVKDYKVPFSDPAEMNHVEEAILDKVSLLYPEVFLALHEFYESRRDCLDPTVLRFDREVQFYLAYLEFIEPLRSAGLEFCYPFVSPSKEARAVETFDLALANKLVHEKSTVVRNDFNLSGRERMLVISGPNQGGKTTFARMFGQLHYLAKLGFPVPGREARLFLCDKIFTHFEKEEQLENLRGKLQDELVRIRSILREATGESIVIMNESFASTTAKDALFLGKKVMQEMARRGMLCVYVTFIDELSALSEATVSMVSTVDPHNPTLRSYKIVRKRADGRAYAIAIAEKYGLTYESLRRRIGP